MGSLPEVYSIAKQVLKEAMGGPRGFRLGNRLTAWSFETGGTMTGIFSERAEAISS